MPKITDPDGLVVGTNLTINTSAKTFTLTQAGSLVAKDGVTFQALYSKFVELWGTDTYNKFPMPFYAIDARSGQFEIGTDGSARNGWAPANDATRQMIRDAGWTEYNAAGNVTRRYLGVVTLGSVSSGAQLYYQRVSGGSPVNFTFTDAVNEAVQVFGDASNGNFDTRTFFRVFAREQGFTYADADLAVLGESEGTGAFVLKFPISNSVDAKVLANDTTVSGSAPYTGITVTYHGTNQNRTIGGTAYPFRVIIDGNNATAEQIYTKVQYLLRQNSDIDSGAGTVTGKTAASLLRFVGDNLITGTGVYIDNFNSSDINRITFTDQNGVARNFPFTAAGAITFNTPLVGALSNFRMYFDTLPGAGNDWGESGAITVNDASGNPITGSISTGSLSFTFDYDGNVQGGRTAGTDAAVVITAVRPGSAKVTVARATITRAVGQNIALVAEVDRTYANP